MNKKLWSKEEEIQLTDLKNQGFTGKEIAFKLNRTESSVYNKIKRLGLATIKNPAWQPEDDKTLISCRNSGLSVKQIAIRLNRSDHAIEMRISRLRDKGLIDSKLNSARNVKFSNEDIISYIQKYPNIRLYELESSININMPSLYSIISTFGSWSAATEAAGIEIAKSGLKRHKDTILYLVYFPDEDFYKVGITQQSVNARLRGYSPFKIVDFVVFDNLADSEYYESIALANVVPFIPSTFGAGKTECFKYNKPIHSIESLLNVESSNLCLSGYE